MILKDILMPVIALRNIESASDEYVILSLTVQEWQAIRDAYDLMKDEEEE